MSFSQWNSGLWGLPQEASPPRPQVSRYVRGSDELGLSVDPEDDLRRATAASMEGYGYEADLRRATFASMGGVGEPYDEKEQIRLALEASQREQAALDDDITAERQPSARSVGVFSGRPVSPSSPVRTAAGPSAPRSSPFPSASRGRGSTRRIRSPPQTAAIPITQDTEVVVTEAPRILPAPYVARSSAFPTPFAPLPEASRIIRTQNEEYNAALVSDLRADIQRYKMEIQQRKEDLERALQENRRVTADLEQLQIIEATREALKPPRMLVNTDSTVPNDDIYIFSIVRSDGTSVTCAIHRHEPLKNVFALAHFLDQYTGPIALVVPRVVTLREGSIEDSNAKISSIQGLAPRTLLRITRLSAAASSSISV